jgi:HSP20 family protein
MTRLRPSGYGEAMLKEVVMVERRGGAFSERVSLQKEVNRLFEQLAHFERTGTGLGMGEWIPGVDVIETKSNLVIKVEAPGVSKNDVSVAFHGHKLVISGEKKQLKDDKAASGYLCLERSFGKFNRVVYIDQAVQLSKASATLGQGVLAITVPKLKDRRGSEFRLTIKEFE